jgi:hypothetical protein
MVKTKKNIKSVNKSSTNTNPKASSTRTKKNKTVLSKSAQKRAERVSEERLTPINRDESLKKVFNWDQMDNLDAGVAFDLVYGFKPDVNFTSEYGETINKVNARKWWERSSAQTQCANAIGNLNQQEDPKCYICGFPIIQGEPTAECEHILPVYKAAMYLTLYNDHYKAIMEKGKDDLMSLNPKEKKIFTEISMEYAWAHKCCNQKKSDNDFIKYVFKRGETGFFKLDFQSTNRVLTNIVQALLSEGKDGHCMEKSLIQNFRDFLGPNKNNLIKKWINERIDILGAKAVPNKNLSAGKVQTIVDYMNHYTSSSNYSMFTLINLCSLISASDMNDVHVTWRKISGLPEPIKEIPPVSQITKAIVITQLTAYANFLSQFNWGRQLEVPKIYEFYKKIFEIPDGISFDVRRDGGADCSVAILGSLLHLNKTEIKIGDFFRNFYAVISYPSVEIDPTTNKNITLFPELIGKKYASNMVGQAFIILLLGRMILKMQHLESDGFFSNNSAIYMQFYQRFQDKYNEEVSKLINIKKNYFDVTRFTSDGSSSNINPFYVFLLVFIQFLNQIDGELTKLFIDSITKEDPELNALFSLDNSSEISARYNELSNLLLSPKDNNKENQLSNMMHAVVLFYMDEAEYLKFYPTWDPSVIDEEDSKFTANAKSIAVGATSLLNILKTTNITEPSEIDEIADVIGKGNLTKELLELVNKNALNLEIVNRYFSEKNPSTTPSEMNINEIITQLSVSDLAQIIFEIDKQDLIKQIIDNKSEIMDTVISFFHITYPEIEITAENMDGNLENLNISELGDIVYSYNMIENDLISLNKTNDSISFEEEEKMGN